MGVGLVTVFVSAWLLADPPTDNRQALGPAVGKLVVFVQPGVSPVADAFEREHLPAIERAAQQAKIPFRVIDVRKGAPEEITTTPFVMFQNHRGRSFYQGSSTTPDGIVAFVRLSRIAAQGKELLRRTKVPVWHTGRAQLAAPIKVARVSGTMPADYDHAVFVKQATKAIMGGFKRFQMVDSVTLRRSDRSFYMDFNPWVSDDGTLFLSSELYSQFHCKKPIFQRVGEPFVGPWDQRERLFAEAAGVLAAAVLDALAEPESGYGLDPLDAAVPLVAWDSLGLGLPAPPPLAATIVKREPLNKHWSLDISGVGESSLLAFHFPAPLDRYHGEVRAVRGELHLPNVPSLSGATGVFEVDVASVTMGETELDAVIRSSSFLDVAGHPTAKFMLRASVIDETPLAYGEVATASFEGTFTMKGVSIPLTLRATFEPIADKDRKVRLRAKGTFQIPLEPFELDGPDGPEHAANTLVFHFRFSLSPAVTD